MKSGMNEFEERIWMHVFTNALFTTTGVSNLSRSAALASATVRMVRSRWVDLEEYLAAGAAAQFHVDLGAGAVEQIGMDEVGEILGSWRPGASEDQSASD